MPLSPSEASALSQGEQMVAGSLMSAIDVHLSRSYDDSGVFSVEFAPRIGVNNKILASIIKRYKAQGWRGSEYAIGLAGQIHIHLRVKEKEEEE